MKTDLFVLLHAFFASKSAEITHEDDVFFQAIDNFYHRAKNDVRELSTKLGNVEKEFAELVSYLGEDPESTPETLFKSLIAFLDDVALALNENEMEKAKQAKRSRDKKERSKLIEDGESDIIADPTEDDIL